MWHGKPAFSHHGTYPTDPTCHGKPDSLTHTRHCDAMSFSQCFSHRFFHRSSDATIARLHPISSNLSYTIWSLGAYLPERFPRHSKHVDTLPPQTQSMAFQRVSKGQEKPACPFLASEVGCRFEPFCRGNCALYGAIAFCLPLHMSHAMPSRGLCDVSACKCRNHRTSQGSSHAEYL